jgi:hypothetical protein
MLNLALRADLGDIGTRVNAGIGQSEWTTFITHVFIPRRGYEN